MTLYDCVGAIKVTSLKNGILIKKYLEVCARMLESARKNLPCESSELSYFIWDSKARWDRFQRFQSVLNGDAVLRNKPSEWGLSRMDNYLLYS